MLLSFRRAIILGSLLFVAVGCGVKGPPLPPISGRPDQDPTNPGGQKVIELDPLPSPTPSPSPSPTPTAKKKKKASH